MSYSTFVAAFNTFARLDREILEDILVYMEKCFRRCPAPYRVAAAEKRKKTHEQNLNLLREWDQMLFEYAYIRLRF